MSLSPSPFVSSRATARIAPDDDMGMGLFATANIDVGQDAIVIRRPFAAVLDSPRLQDTCSGCFGTSGADTPGARSTEEAGRLKACTQCRVVRYCDKVSSEVSDDNIFCEYNLLGIYMFYDLCLC